MIAATTLSGRTQRSMHNICIDVGVPPFSKGGNFSLWGLSDTDIVCHNSR